MTNENSLIKLEEYLAEFPTKTYKKGESLLAVDKKVESIFLLLSGYVRQYTLSTKAEEFTHNILKPHSLFPFHLALNQLPNPHYFQAITLVRVAVAPADDVASHLLDHPEISLALSKKLASGLNQLSFRTESLLFGTARQKLTAILYLLGKRFGQPTSTKSTVRKSSNNQPTQLQLNSFPITHQFLASLTGLTRETVSLEMMKLKKQGLIDYSRQKIALLDIETLKEISSLPFYY